LELFHHRRFAWTVEQKILELKNLYDEGFIDKDEYDAKKKEILNSM